MTVLGGELESTAKFSGNLKRHLCRKGYSNHSAMQCSGGNFSRLSLQDAVFFRSK